MNMNIFEKHIFYESLLSCIDSFLASTITKKHFIITRSAQVDMHFCIIQQRKKSVSDNLKDTRTLHNIPDFHSFHSIIICLFNKGWISIFITPFFIGGRRCSYYWFDVLYVYIYFFLI